MAVLPQHIQPTTREDCVDTWKRFLRISVPSKDCIKGLIIRHWVDTTRWDGKPLDALLYVSETIKEDAEVKIIGLIFSDTKPDDRYPIHVLWVCKGEKTWLPLMRTGGAP